MSLTFESLGLVVRATTLLLLADDFVQRAVEFEHGLESDPPTQDAGGDA